MAVKVLITRRFKRDSIKEAHRLLNELRSMVTIKLGYISGQTLVSASDPDKVLVISTWTNKKRWDEWYESSKRKEFTQKLNEILQSPEQVEVFYVGEKEPEWVDMA